MKIAILGGGITGLTAAYYLSKKGHQVTLLEKESVLGGLAAGFSPPGGGWEWPLERAYHHLFASDKDILGFAEEIGFNKIFFQSPATDSLYERNGKFKMIPVDTPLDFLRFPYLTLSQKIRSSAVLAFLKFSPFLPIYEKYTAKEFIEKFMGKKMWQVFFQELFRKKFGKYAGNILASFIWARIKVRTKKLGYIRGGFQTFVNHIEKTIINHGVVVKKGTEVDLIEKVNEARRHQGYGGQGKFMVNGEMFDTVISTLPTAIMSKLIENIFSEKYLARFSKLHYLHSVGLIIESKQPLLEKTYWLNICTDKLPFMVLVQHTNMVDKKRYGGNHLLYVGNYVDRDNKLIKMNKEEILKFFLPYLKQINTKYSILNTRYYVFKAPFAQPIFDAEFVKNKPNFITPVKNFYIANLDMTYPQDRGTNYAVKLGREVAQLL